MRAQTVTKLECERALFTGFRNLVIEQFENESTSSVKRGNLQRFVRTTHRPAGLLSTEMSKKVRFLTMAADGHRSRMSMSARRLCAGCQRLLL